MRKKENINPKQAAYDAMMENGIAIIKKPRKVKILISGDKITVEPVPSRRELKIRKLALRSFHNKRDTPILPQVASGLREITVHNNQLLPEKNEIYVTGKRIMKTTE